MAKKTQGTAVAKQRDSLAVLIKKAERQIEAVLPKHLSAERVMMVAWTLIQRTPKLKECTAESVVQSIVQASTLGLELGRHAHLVPFGNTCTMIPDYKGIVHLARNAGAVRQIDARIVFSNDFFDVEYGLEPRLIHKSDPFGDRGEMVGVYAVATLPDGEKKFEVMSKADVDKIKNRSKAASNGPWVTDYLEMAKKTVIKRLCKLLPQSYELPIQQHFADAIELDNRAESGDWSGVTQFDDEEATRKRLVQKTNEQTQALKDRLARAQPEEVEEIKELQDDESAAIADVEAEEEERIRQEEQQELGT